MKRIKIYSFYSDEENAIKDIFLKSLRDDWDLDIRHQPEGGEWGTPHFSRLMRKKIDSLIGWIKENWGDIIIWSDIDVQFFSRCKELIMDALANNDIVFLAEHWPKKEINSGFMAMRCNQNTLALFEAVAKADFEKFKFHEQSALNNILNDPTMNIKWEILPEQFWAKSHGGQPPRGIVLHHANCTTAFRKNGRIISSVELKIRQLKRIKRFVWLRKHCPLL